MRKFHIYRVIPMTILVSKMKAQYSVRVKFFRICQFIGNVYSFLPGRNLFRNRKVKINSCFLIMRLALFGMVIFYLTISSCLTLIFHYANDLTLIRISFQANGLFVTTSFLFVSLSF